jgi:hypothetical protein
LRSTTSASHVSASAEVELVGARVGIAGPAGREPRRRARCHRHALAWWERVPLPATVEPVASTRVAHAHATGGANRRRRMRGGLRAPGVDRPGRRPANIAQLPDRSRGGATRNGERACSGLSWRYAPATSSRSATRCRSHASLRDDYEVLFRARRAGRARLRGRRRGGAQTGGGFGGASWLWRTSARRAAAGGRRAVRRRHRPTDGDPRPGVTSIQGRMASAAPRRDGTRCECCWSRGRRRQPAA